MPRKNAQKPDRKHYSKLALMQSRPQYAPMPKHARAKLIYADTIQLSPGIGSWGVHVFSANGLFDPDITGGGHQPIGFDQFIALYNHYTVVSSRCTVFPSTAVTANVNPSRLLLALTANGTTTSSWTGSGDDLVESVGMIQRNRQIHLGRMEMAGYGREPAKLIGRFDPANFFGVAKETIVGSALYRGNVGANPTEQAFFEVVATSIAGNTPGTATISVLLEYDVVFTEPKPIGPS